MKKEESAQTRNYIFFLLGCMAAVLAVGILLWQPQFADTESLNNYESDTEQETVTTTEPVGNIPSLHTEEEQDLTDGDSEAEEPAEEENTDEAEEAAAAEEDIPKEPVSFALPMEKAEVVRGYSMDALSYDETMEDWRVHGATDFGGKTGDAVTAISDGTVVKIGEDMLNGPYVIVNHAEDVQSKYTGIAGLCVKEGDNVIGGQKLAVLGEPMPSEAKQGVHLHLEVTKDGIPLDIEAMIH